MSKQQQESGTEAFRDSVTTIGKDGKRVWLYPKLQKGKLYFRRHSLGYLFLILMFVGPFLQWKGYPLFLFNVLERTFIIFGIPFFPQDFFLFGIGMITFVVFYNTLYYCIWSFILRLGLSANHLYGNGFQKN
jgi:hypothetical protein